MNETRSAILSGLLSQYAPPLGFEPEELVDQFVHLNGHTIHSHGDGLSDCIELAKAAKKFGMDACAITDHGVGYGLLEFYLSCQKAGVKPILGSELNENYERYAKAHERKNFGIKSYHLPVLAMTFTGYQNLCRILTNAASDEGLAMTPDGVLVEEASVAWIRANNLGHDLVALTGGTGGRLAEILLTHQDLFGAIDWLTELQATFSKVYLELQFHGKPHQQRLNLLLLELHKRTGVPLIATRNFHYILQQDGTFHDAYVEASSKGHDRMDSHNYYFCSQQEMYYWVAEHPDYVETCESLSINPFGPLLNSVQLAEMISVELPIGKSLMPPFPVEAPYSETAYLRKLCVEALLRYAVKMKQRGTPIYLPHYIERLEWELQVICDRGNAGYMLILWWVIRKCAENGIITGPGRGSAASSLAVFLLTITKLDPLMYGLLFQRFLSPDRLDEPDIDVDIADVQRGKVIRFVTDKFGEAHVAQIGTHGTLAVKAATQALGKALGLSNDEVVALTKPLPPKWPDQTDMTFQKLQEIVKDDPDHGIIGDIELDEVEHLRKLAEQYWAGVHAVKGLAEAIERVTGAKKSIGIHAGGVAICPIPIETLVPLTNAPNAAVVRVTQFDMNGLSELGVLKMDLLGLRTLSVIKKCLDLIKQTDDVDIDLAELPLDLKEVFQIYAKGRTHGIFQANGKACQGIAVKMKPNSFEELIDLLALARPGPMDAEVRPGMTMVDQYIENKIKLFNDEPIEIPHPDLYDLLTPTKGVWVYQEQLMIGAHILAGFTPGAQDTLRKATAKKKPELQQALKYVFIYGSQSALPHIRKRIEELKTAGLALKKLEEWEKGYKEAVKMGTSVPGGLAKGYDLAFLEHLYEQWLTFAGYSFNKSHSAAYALVSYWTAYLKTYYPAHYLCALLSSEASKPEKTAANLQEARRAGIPILPPDVNHSAKDFGLSRLSDGRVAIVYGLLGIRGVGEKAVDSILEAQPFVSIDDFLDKVNLRVINRGIMAILIKAGAFDSFNENRFFVWNYYHFTWRKDPKKKQGEYERFDEEDWKSEYAWNWERELMGNYISGHPLQDLPAQVWEHIPHRGPVEMGGVFQTTGYKEFKDRKGRDMAVGKIETVSGLVLSFTIFADKWEKYKDHFSAGAVLILRGEKDANRNSITVSSVIKGTQRRAKKAKALDVGACAPPVTVTDPIQQMLNEEDIERECE